MDRRPTMLERVTDAFDSLPDCAVFVLMLAALTVTFAIAGLS